MTYSVAIIGGGLSGLCAGVKLGQKLKENLLILEGNKRVGKKILATGNGQGNITNTIVSEKYYHGDVEFAKLALERYSNVELLSFFEELGLITGQKPMITTAKKSISNFKIREGQKNGAKVTLRNKIMYEFFDKIISVALPRVRDFSGLSRKSFDQFGNYTFGFKEQLVFPEISYEKIEKVRGMDITIVTTAKNKEDSLELLDQLGLPFKKEVK